MCERVLLMFSKRGALRFTGHLDLLRVFQRTIRRADLPIAYSKGFNPHMLLSFALPLPLGMESANDYAEAVLDTLPPVRDIHEKINANAPGGLAVTDVRLIPDGAPGVASQVFAAEYLTVAPCYNADSIRHAVSALLSETAVTVSKKTKGGIKDADIRPDIYDMRVERADGRFCYIFMRLAANGARFLNPRLASALVLNRANADCYAESCDIIRLELYDKSFRPIHEIIK